MRLHELANQERKIAAEAHFGRRRFFIKSGDQESDRLMTFEFAKQLFDDLMNAGKDPQAFFEYEDGTIEDFTEFFT